MKQVKKVIPVLAILAASLASCGGNGFQPNQNVLDAVKDAQKLSRDELFKKAAAELGDKGVLKILATTSRGGKDAVKNAFVANLQKHNPNITTSCLQYDTTVDGVIYTTLLGEIDSKVTDGYSGTVTQDAYQLSKKGIETGYFVNYVPKEWKEAAGVDVKNDSDPFTLQYNFKTWMYNNKNGLKIDNIWDITDSSFKGKLDLMDPSNENVTKGCLIALTSKENTAMLEKAFKESTANTDVKIEDYSKYGSKKYAYAFIDRFLTNGVYFADDGEAMNHLAQTPGNVGWIVYSKLLKVNETEAITKKNIVVASLGDKNEDGSKLTKSSLAGFGGFMYKHYLQVMPYAQYPYATCAFFNLISTTAEAYSVWAGDVGDYPTMPEINKDRSKDGVTAAQKAGVEGYFSCLNDPSSEFWVNTANCLVENPTYIGENFEDVNEYIMSVIAKR